MQESRLRSRIGIETEAKISLKEVIERVLNNDPELAISHIYLEQAGNSIKASQGYFDPVFSLDAMRSRTSIAVASAIGGSKSGRLTSKELIFVPKISGNSPWLGSTYSLTFSDARQESDSTFSMLNPQYPTSVTLNVTQPLWRGLRIDSGRRSLLVARKNRELSSEQLRQRVIERVTQAVQYYWELALCLAEP